ncbi:hypothetical protein BV898_13845 [Hypsibius exemplaris]|uniref:XK-related protein n=1 Tax=Hypsibius exemplaris TaxID=2072580 RepID=A0A1W0W9N8_HYPEX|nr:hypothetical protein BV898_13845 [Hypsibius exemplaris]
MSEADVEIPEVQPEVRTRVRPLQIQCQSDKITKDPSLMYRFYTWLVCRKDPFDIDWTASAAVFFATGLYVADLISDVAVAVYHFQEKNFGYASISFAIVVVPLLVSVGYYKIYKKYPLYLTHPFEPLYWCKITSDEYRLVVRQRREPMGREEAWTHYNTVKNFRISNWARVSSTRLEVHLEALPQLIFQSYTIAELLHDRDLKNISWFSWASVGLSTISLAMYHHTLALAQAKILDKDADQMEADASKGAFHFYYFRPSPTILFDFVCQGFLDGVYVVARAVALGCLFAVGPYMWLIALVFLTMHLSVVSVLMWLAAPKKKTEFQSDFRLILYNRTNHPDILTAAVASLIFPPLMDIKVDQTSTSCIDFLLTAGTKTFWIACMLQLLETSAALLFWYRLNGDHIAVNTRTLTMATDVALLVTVLMGHIIFVTCVYMPFKQRETQKCTRKKGIMAKCWLLELAEVHYAYLQDVVMPRLTNTGFSVFTRKNSAVNDISQAAKVLHHIQNQGDMSPLLGSQCTLTMEDLTWLTDTLLIVSDGDQTKPAGIMDYARWQKTHFFRTAIQPEKNLCYRIAKYAQRQLNDVVRFGAVYDTEAKEPLILDCRKMITFWSDIIFRCITHQELPAPLFNLVDQAAIRELMNKYSDAIRQEPHSDPDHASKNPTTAEKRMSTPSFHSLQLAMQHPVTMPPTKPLVRETMIWD